MAMEIYTDTSLMSGDNHIEALIPFYGDKDRDEKHPDYGRFDELLECADGYDVSENIEEADICLYPIKYSNDDKFKKFFDHARAKNKKVIVFFNDDSAEEIPIEPGQGYIFRTSFYGSSKKANEFALPGWSIDYGFEAQARTPSPSVGFCGFPFNNPVRASAISQLRSSDKVDAEFILRNEFFWGWDGTPESFDTATKVREEYVQNLKSSPYTLCVRGGGNFSYRLYESLNVGGIPVFVDTDCVLPFEDEINWGAHVVWIPPHQVESIDTVLAQVHSTLDNEGFQALQLQNRGLWNSYIRPKSFIRKAFEKISNLEGF